MSDVASSHDEARVREVLDDLLSALSEKQAERVMAHYAENPVLFTLAPPLIARGDDGGEGLRAWFATWRGRLRFEVRDLEITTSGDAAFSSSLVRMSGTQTDGQEVHLWFRRTLGLREIGAEWKIVHEHESVPFYMDGTLKAAVDLQP
jgi:PhnB protein